MIGPNLLELKRGALPGFCGVCCRKLPKGARPGQFVCVRRRCAREYARLYALDNRRPSGLRRVLEVRSHPDSTRRALLVLECGHVEDVPLSKARRAVACDTCPARRLTPAEDLAAKVEAEVAAAGA